VRTRTRRCQGWSWLASKLINVGIVKTAFEVTASRDTASIRSGEYRGTISTKTETIDHSEIKQLGKARSRGCDRLRNFEQRRADPSAGLPFPSSF